MIESLRELAAALARSMPEVSGVLLFGSLARGDFGRRSDADVLVCLRSGDSRRPADRLMRFLPAFFDAPLPVDVFALTEEEIAARLAEGNRFWRRALGEAVLLAGSLPAAPGQGRGS